MPLVPGNSRYQSQVKKSKQVSAFRGGPMGSGTASVKDIPTPKLGKTDTSSMMATDMSSGRPVVKPIRKVRPGAVSAPMGSGNVKTGTTKTGSGDSTRYVDVPEPNKDRGKVSTPTNPNSAGSGKSSSVSVEDAGSSRPSPAQAKKDLATTLKNAGEGKQTGADKGSGESSGGKMTLNDFMDIASKSGKSNAYRRGYQMFKNYQKTGKLPARRVGPDK